MASDFVKSFAAEEKLTEEEVQVLEAANVRTPEDVDSLVRGFPSITALGLRLPLISNAVATQVSAAYTSIGAAMAARPPQVALGAAPPPGVPYGLQSAAGLPPAAPGASPPSAAAIDLRLPLWPVRDQGQRGTCVAFGATACVEQFGTTPSGSTPDDAEQFLYWAIKDHSADPNKSRDGTWLQFARDMFITDGICDETLCPYVGTPAVPVKGPTPTAGAVANARARTHTASTYLPRPTNAATQVHLLLQRGWTVAISLPVFQDPALPNGPNNWTTAVGWAYGRILNPPLRSVVVGGHCVCVTGFVPDPAEDNGGYFIIRNSWGAAWANLAPSPGNSHAPEPGYGEVSASYVDMYCWELLQL